MTLQSQQQTPAVLEMEIPWDDKQGEKHIWSGAFLSLQDKLCVLLIAVLGSGASYKCPSHMGAL